MAHTLTLAPETADETVYTADRITRLDPVKTHSGLSDFRIDLPKDLALEDHAFDEMWLEAGDEFLFRGYVFPVSNKESTHEATIGGYGIEYDLKRTQKTYTFSNELVESAITTVGNDTSFNWTVHSSTATDSVSGEQAQEADTTSEFSDILTIADDEPLAVSGDSVNLLQTCFTDGQLVFNLVDSNGIAQFTSNADFTHGEGVQLGDEGDFAEWTFSNSYTIPAENFRMSAREEATGSDPPQIEWSVDGDRVETFTIGGASLLWRNHNDFEPTSDLTAGTHTVRVEATGSGTDNWNVGTIAPNDDRFSYTFDNTLDGSQGHLDGPELFPTDGYQHAFDVAGVSWSVNEATLTTSWNDTTGNQRIGIRLDGGTWFDTPNATTTGAETFGSEKGSGLQGRARFVAFGSRTGDTPKTGFNGQSISSWTINFDGDDKPVINSAEISGNFLEIMADLHDRGRRRFWFPHEKNAKPAVSAERGQVVEALEATVNSRDRSLDPRDYFNSVTVRGQTDDDGNRIEATAKSQSEIDEVGETEPLGVDDATITTETEAEALARAILTEKVQNREATGTFYLPATNLTAGPSYTVTWSDGSTSTVPSEEVSYQVANDEFETVLELNRDPIDLSEVVPGLDSGVRNAKRGF